MPRSRPAYLLVGALVIVLGLASRRYAGALPMFLAEYAGDTLWAAMVFVGIGLLAPRWSSVRVAVIALAFSYFVEGSQLYHASWIEALRHTRLGGLILGYSFLWSDLACYTVGVAVGLAIETSASRIVERRVSA